jgi:ATP-dependent helicase HrpB
VREHREVVFDEEAERVVERVRQVYEDLVLRETVRQDVDPDRAAAVLAAAVARDPRRALAPGEAAERLLDRLRFLARAMPELGLPENPDELLSRAAAMLASGKRSFAELRRGDAGGAVRALLDARQLRALDREAPEEYRLPSGRVAPLRYERDRPPAAAARIQELFGLRATPRLAAGRVPIVVEILAPSRRPVQVTDDLESFWQRTYPEVRKELRGRYPKHAWPEDPTAALPDRRRPAKSARQSG